MNHVLYKISGEKWTAFTRTASQSAHATAQNKSMYVLCSMHQAGLNIKAPSSFLCFFHSFLNLNGRIAISPSEEIFPFETCNFWRLLPFILSLKYINTAFETYTVLLLRFHFFTVWSMKLLNAKSISHRLFPSYAFTHIWNKHNVLLDVGRNMFAPSMPLEDKTTFWTLGALQYWSCVDIGRPSQIS